MTENILILQFASERKHINRKIYEFWNFGSAWEQVRPTSSIVYKRLRQ